MASQQGKELIQNIREWIQLDNEIKELQKELKMRKTKQQQKTLLLLEIMKNNELDGVDVPNGRLAHVTRVSKAPITKKTLLGLLSKFYDGDISQALAVNNFIMNNRQEVIKETIALKRTKDTTRLNQEMEC
jgi:ABC-type transport system involved in Fe-S cluster assembly fused permease/ATPase subunit